MICDALFQLGMGPVELDATQTEDTVSLPVRRTRNDAFRAPGYAAPRIPPYLNRPLSMSRLRGNSAKALLNAR